MYKFGTLAADVKTFLKLKMAFAKSKVDGSRYYFILQNNFELRLKALYIYGKVCDTEGEGKQDNWMTTVSSLPGASSFPQAVKNGGMYVHA